MGRMSSEGGLVFVLCGMVIGEAGFMLSNVSLTISGSGSASEDERGLAARLLNTSIQLGNAWGLGVVATVVAAATAAFGGEAAGPEALVGGLRWGSTPARASPSWACLSSCSGCARRRKNRVLDPEWALSPARAREASGG